MILKIRPRPKAEDFDSNPVNQSQDGLMRPQEQIQSDFEELGFRSGENFFVPGMQ